MPSTVSTAPLSSSIKPALTMVPCAPSRLPLPARHRAQRSTAQSEQIGKCGNERHKGKAQADTCQRKRALAGDFADINAVYNIIQQVEQLRDEHRCGPPQVSCGGCCPEKNQFAANEYSPFKIRKKQGEVRASPCTIVTLLLIFVKNPAKSVRGTAFRTPFGGRAGVLGSVPVQR